MNNNEYCAVFQILYSNKTFAWQQRWYTAHLLQKASKRHCMYIIIKDQRSPIYFDSELQMHSTLVTRKPSRLTVSIAVVSHTETLHTTGGCRLALL